MAGQRKAVLNKEKKDDDKKVVSLKDSQNNMVNYYENAYKNKKD